MRGIREIRAVVVLDVGPTFAIGLVGAARGFVLAQLCALRDPADTIRAAGDQPHLEDTGPSREHEGTSPSQDDTATQPRLLADDLLHHGDDPVRMRIVAEHLGGERRGRRVLRMRRSQRAEQPEDQGLAPFVPLIDCISRTTKAAGHLFHQGAIDEVDAEAAGQCVTHVQAPRSILSGERDHPNRFSLWISSHGAQYMTDWPIRISEVQRAAHFVRATLPPTPLRAYPVLDDEIGTDMRIFVKHENHQPTNAFKVRSNLFAVHELDIEEKRRGVITASRGNHGLGLAWAGRRLGVPVTICVPQGNNPEKNAGIRALGATLIEEGRDYDESVQVALAHARTHLLQMIHSTNDPRILTGAATLGLEILEQEPELEALVIAVGGGSQAVGALTAVRAQSRPIPVFGVQAAGAAAIHDSWHARAPRRLESAVTFADGLATRESYPGTFPALLEGLTDFVTVTDHDIAEAVRILLRTTHNLAEGAGAAGLAGAIALRNTLAGRRVGVVLSGGNLDQATLRRIVNREI